MSGFERGNDAFGAGEEARGVESGFVGDGGVFGATLIGEPSVLGTNGGIVEAGGDGMSGGDLTVFVLQDVSVSALKDAGASADKTLCGGETRGVFAELAAAATRFNANEFDTGITEELVKEADGIRTAADASEKMSGQSLFGGEDLLRNRRGRLARRACACARR